MHFHDDNTFKKFVDLTKCNKKGLQLENTDVCLVVHYTCAHYDIIHMHITLLGEGEDNM